MSEPERPITFECRGETLVGMLHAPAHPASSTGLLVVVGGPQYRVGSHRQFVLMARALALAGFSVLRFDYRGMGDSGGAMRDFDDVGDDVAAAVEVFLREQPGLEGVVLCALCDGAPACSMYCARDSRVRGLILMNPWVRTASGEAQALIKHYYLRRVLHRSFWNSVFSGRYQLRKSMRDFFRSLARARGGAARSNGSQRASFIERMYSGLRGFGGPVLFVISGRDLVAREFEDLCRGSAAWRALVQRPGTRFAQLPSADHTFSSRTDLERAVEECRSWLATLAK
ncbi:MAG TPA: hydrolase 1, exosortase A system-associated [Steroidobacteraceae bacterium]|nr:hydrolase 1, exosortase A system-associated [Steroidobacteraceae bacterium]